MDLDRLFPHILKPAFGCTEPVAVALAVAAATQAAGGWTPGRHLPLAGLRPEQVSAIRVRVTKKIFKNSFSIAIPNADGEKGIVSAGALGLFGDPGRELELFASLPPGTADHARRLVAEGRVTVNIIPPERSDFRIEAEVDLDLGLAGPTSGACLILDRHNNIVLLRQGTETLLDQRDRPVSADTSLDACRELRQLDIAGIVALAEGTLPAGVRELLRETIRLNRTATDAGLLEPLGLGAGFYVAGQSGSTQPDLAWLAAAGSDARMAGHPVAVMSSAGSGNQGIIATIPVVAFAEESGQGEERLLRAVALSHLVTMYITLHIGVLSPLCGVAVKAGIGAACGITWLMGGGAEEIGRAVKIMAATLSGMLCDGAKPGCALKVGTSADMAARAAALAMRRVDVGPDNGIVAESAEETLANLAELGQAMDVVDQKIVEIMNAKAGGGPARRGANPRS